MKLSKSARRLVRLDRGMLTILSAVAFVLGFASRGPRSMDESFSLVFFVGAIPWLLFAFFSGGFASTYRAPIIARPRTADLWFYTSRHKGALVLPPDNPATIGDLRTKMATQTGPMVLGVLSGFGLFGLSYLFWYVAIAGYAVLIGTVSVLAALLIADSVTTGMRSPSG